MAMQDAVVRKQATRIKHLEAALEAERSLWKSAATVDRTARGNPDQMHTFEALDNILDTEKKIHAWSSLWKIEYAFLLMLYCEEIDRLGKTPLFRDDEYRASDPGNRCKLYKRHALLLSLVHLYTGMHQEALGAMFGIDQSAVSRYLALNRRVLEKILPTAKTLSKAISLCRTKRAVLRFLQGGPHGTFLLDGARCPRLRPKDKKKQKKWYSGKIKRHSINTLFGTNKKNVILWISTTRPGRVHDMKMVGELTKVFHLMAKKGARIRVLADSGFQGIEKRLPGIEAAVPKKRPRNGQLTKKQKASNRKISSERVSVEHDIGRVKNYKILTRPYGGTEAEFNRELNIVTGLVNFHTLFSEIRSGTGLYGTLMAERRRERLKRHRRR